MLRTMLRAKIHRATVSEAKLHYQGSLTIPYDLMKKLDILEGEMVLVANITTGARFETYAIRGAKPRHFCLNGAAARCGQPGDLIIVMVFAQMDEQEARRRHALVARMGPGNRVLRLTRSAKRNWE